VGENCAWRTFGACLAARCALLGVRCANLLGALSRLRFVLAPLALAALLRSRLWRLLLAVACAFGASLLDV